MSMFSCLVFCLVAICFSSVHAEDGPATMDDVLDIIFECAKEHGVKASEMMATSRTKDVTIVNPCFWSCSLKKGGFLDDKGKYVLNPGLTYVRKFVDNDKAYNDLENAAKQCESVNDKAEGATECETGAVVAACFMEQMMAIVERPSNKR